MVELRVGQAYGGKTQWLSILYLEALNMEVRISAEYWNTVEGQADLAVCDY